MVGQGPLFSKNLHAALILALEFGPNSLSCFVVFEDDFERKSYKPGVCLAQIVEFLFLIHVLNLGDVIEIGTGDVRRIHLILLVLLPGLIELCQRARTIGLF